MYASALSAALAAMQAALTAVINATVPAIGTLITGAVPPRTADAGNTRASAALPGGGAWDGAGRLTDDPGVFSRVDADITCPVDAAGMFYIIHGPTVAAVNACNPAAPVLPCRVDAWPAAVVWTNHRAPVSLLDKAYRLAWRGTAGSVVAVTANLDPRQAPDFFFDPTPVAIAIGTIVPIPPGARSFSLSVSATATGVATAAAWRTENAAAAVLGTGSNLNNGGTPEYVNGTRRAVFQLVGGGVPAQIHFTAAAAASSAFFRWYTGQ